MGYYLCASRMSTSNPASNSGRTVCGALIIAALTVALYWPVTNHEFIGVYDDDKYVLDNPQVRGGLTLEVAGWAFTSGYASNWHPLTWLSHMMDCQLWGLDAGKHHLTNVLLHAANTALVFLLVFGFTGAYWRCIGVAALFAWHPLRAESVAWIAERKDVLSTLFFLLTLWAYGRHARSRRNIENSISLHCLHSGNYWLALLFFALGLMSKPMLVTLPFVLLLLDFWPLGRFQSLRWTALLVEKTPFMLLATASSLVTFLVQRAGGSVATLELIPLTERIGNAVVSYVRYLGKTIWPVNLAVPYPYPGEWPSEVVLGSVLLLSMVTAGVVWLARRMPWLAVGWFWYLGTLVPVIGLVQVGEQALADRYTYIPHIGLFLALVWGGENLLRRLSGGRLIAGGLMVAIVAVCAMATRRQVGRWQNSLVLFEHAVSVTQQNATAQGNLGNALAERGRLEEAVNAYQLALDMNPANANAHNNYGTALMRMGRIEEALQHYRTAMELSPQDASVHFNRANALANQGRTDEALRSYQEALRLDATYARAHNNLAILLVRVGRLDEALTHVQIAVELEPWNSEVQNNMGNILAGKGENEAAVSHYLRALHLEPKLAKAHFNLATSLTQLGCTNAAMASYETAAKLDPLYWQPRLCLADINAKSGDWKQAVQWYASVVKTETNHFVSWNNLGTALMKLGQAAEAADCFRHALAIRPEYADAHANFGAALARLGRLAEATEQYTNALRIKPQVAETHHSLGRVLYHQGQVEESLHHFSEAVKCKPDWAQPLNDAAWILAAAAEAHLRNGQQAVQLAERANELTGRTKPNFLGTLAAAYAEAGRFRDAVLTAEMSARLADEAGLEEFAAQTRTRLELYRAERPYRENDKR